MKQVLQAFAASCLSALALVLVARSILDLDSFVAIVVIVFFLPLMWPVRSSSRRDEDNPRRDKDAEEAQGTPRWQGPLHEEEVEARNGEPCRSEDSSGTGGEAR